MYGGLERIVFAPPWLLFIDIAPDHQGEMTVNPVSVTTLEVRRDGLQELLEFHRRPIRQRRSFIAVTHRAGILVFVRLDRALAERCWVSFAGGA
jgi:hypothetical protein